MDRIAICAAVCLLLSGMSAQASAASQNLNAAAGTLARLVELPDANALPNWSANPKVKLVRTWQNAIDTTKLESPSLANIGL
jgi:hypothetical protein